MTKVTVTNAAPTGRSFSAQNFPEGTFFRVGDRLLLVTAWSSKDASVWDFYEMESETYVPDADPVYFPCNHIEVICHD